VPILVGGSNAEIPEEGRVPDVRATTVTWTSASGRVTSLSDFESWHSGAMIMPGVAGIGLPDYTYYSDQSPTFDGSVVRGVRAGSRQITLPIHIWAMDRPSCLERFHRLARDFHPGARTPGVLTFIEANGSSRRIEAFYAEGMSGEDDDDRWGRHWMTFVLVFTAPSPWFLGEDKTLTFRTGNEEDMFFPLPPWKVRDSQVLGSLEIVNLGEVDTYPVWTIKGPATAATLTNTTTGESFVLTRTLTDSDIAVIDTREGIKSASLNGSTNLWPDLNSAAVLWPLRPGSNSVSLNVAGASEGSHVQVSYTARYLTGY
jgi:hypothetical protein